MFRNLNPHENSRSFKEIASEMPMPVPSLVTEHDPRGGLYHACQVLGIRISWRKVDERTWWVFRLP